MGSLPLVIFGSSREDGNTAKVVDQLFLNAPHDFVNLSDHPFPPYRYGEEEIPKIFIQIVEAMAEADQVVFATPVYWYSMSAQMKNFFDNFSYLVRRRKDLGRALAGKKTYLVVTGGEEALPEGYEIPFQRSSNYLDMDYQGAFFVPFVGEDPAEDFSEAAAAFAAEHFPAPMDLS